MFERLRNYLSSRRPPPGIDRPVDDWAAGDLGECTYRGAWRQYPSEKPIPGPRFGEVVRVHDVALKYDCVALALAGHPGGFYAACCFRKLRACDRSFERRPRACRPVHEGADA